MISVTVIKKQEVDFHQLLTVLYNNARLFAPVDI